MLSLRLVLITSFWAAVVRINTKSDPTLTY